MAKMFLRFMLVILFVFITNGPRSSVSQQQSKVYLEQGELIGMKVYPENSKTAVYCFLGVPYAQPPLRELRFAPPHAHNGWSGSYRATRTKPICPQLLSTKYDQPRNTLNYITDMDEDCLYLNIWVPEAWMRNGNLPVLVVITGEDMSYDWAIKNVLGIDFAAVGGIVVSVQYRTNIFGWLSLDNNLLPGNFGLLDQSLALAWIKKNIGQFGGDANKVTVLGHGTTGAPCSLAHTINNVTSAADTGISKLILMSGGDIAGALNARKITLLASSLMLQKLGCQFEEQIRETINCLRMKSVNDLLKAYESVYQNGNSTYTLGPVLNVTALNVLETLQQNRVPILLGITSKEGGSIQDYWLEMAREDCFKLMEYLNYTMLPKILRSLDMPATDGALKTILIRQFVGNEVICSVPSILEAMELLISESLYELYFFDVLEKFEEVESNVYAYVYDAANGIDMQGKINIYGGAPHGADFALLFGPSLFQEITRRRPTPAEVQQTKNLRQIFLNFMNTGKPMSKNNTWLPYTKEQKSIFNLATLNGTEALLPLQANGRTFMDFNARQQMIYQLNTRYNMHLRRVHSYWLKYLPSATQLNCEKTQYLKSMQHMKQLKMYTSDAARYKQGFIATLILVCLLLACLIFCIYLLRRDQFLLAAASTTTSTRFSL